MLLNLSSSSHHTQWGQTNWKVGVWSRESSLLPGQVRRTEQFMLKMPKLSDDLGEESFIIEFGGEVCCWVTFPQLVGGELTDGGPESQSSVLWFQPVWGPHACTSLLGRDLSSCSRTQICIRLPCVTLGRTRTLPHHCTAFLTAFLCLCLPHYLQKLNLPFGTQGRNKRLELFSFEQEIGGYGKTFVPESALRVRLLTGVMLSQRQNQICRHFSTVKEKIN